MTEEKELEINSTEEVVQEEQKETYKEMSPIKLILRRFCFSESFFHCHPPPHRWCR